MGLHISRIVVENFRNFRHLNIGDFPPHAVIVGENGVGKSNLLEAIRLVLDPAMPDSRRLLRDEDIWEGHPTGLSGGAQVTVVVELQGFDTDIDAQSVLSAAVVNFAPYTARLTYQFFPRVAVDPSDDADARPKKSLTAQDYDFRVFAGDSEANDVRAIRREVTLRVLTALRDAENELRNWRRSPLRDLLERLPLNEKNLESTASAIATAVAELTKDGNIAKLEDHLENRFSAMLGPRLAVQPTLGFASSQPDELIRAVRLYLDTARRRGISDASLGSANVIFLGLLLEALSQQRQSDQFVASLVAIEEPEAHLHVTLQRHLFGYLLRTEESIILTTHSPHIAAVTPIRSFVVLRSTKDGTVGSSTATLTVTANEAADLERYIDVSRAEVLFASAVILVEGLAELYVLPALANALRFDLEAYGVVVASAHGTDFKPYRALLGQSGLNTPHVVITDGDAAPDKRGRSEAGLQRGAGLRAGATFDASLTNRIDKLPKQDSGNYQPERRPLVSELADVGIYVGSQTLETDLCPFFGTEINLAFRELTGNKNAIEDVRLGVANEQSEAVDSEVRANMLQRISDLGKGRFAQRLAAHIAEVDVCDRVRSLQGIDADEDITSESVRDLGAPAYLFLALNDIALKTREIPLFEDVSDVSGGADYDVDASH